MTDPPSLVDALTAAMAMVPGLYSRNRMFERFKHPDVRRARARARMLRSLLRFVTREDSVLTVAGLGDRHRVSYRLPQLRLERTVQLTELELSVLRVMVAKGPCPKALAEQPTDRPRVESALALLPPESKEAS